MQRVCVIGPGPIGNRHCDMYVENPLAELVGACAINHLDIWVRRGWPGLELDMGATLRAACGVVGGKGGGRPDMAMAGGSFKAPVFTVSWPTGEFGGMGLEGAVKLGFRKELESIADPAALAAAAASQLFDDGGVGFGSCCC